jgi:single-strand DNA-binding protein
MQMNRVVIAGYVTKKPEARYLPSGTPVANVRVGESSRYENGSGETKEHTNWHSLSFYGKLAQVALALEKGDNLYVDGRIEQRQFTPRDGSKPRMVHEIVVTQCHLIAPPVRSASGTHSVPGKDVLDGVPIAADEVQNDWPVAS